MKQSNIKLNNDFYDLYLSESIKTKTVWFLFYISIKQQQDTNNSIVVINMLEEWKLYDQKYHTTSYDVYKYYARSIDVLQRLYLIEKNTISSSFKFGQKKGLAIINKFDFNLNNKILTIEFNKDFVAKYLSSDKNYFSINDDEIYLLLEDKIAVKSFSFYLWIKSNVYVGRTIKIHIKREELWKRFNVSEKTPYKNIKSKYILPIIEDINNNTNIEIKLKEIKLSKQKVDTVEFLVKHSKRKIVSKYNKKMLFDMDGLSRTPVDDGTSVSIQDLLNNSKAS